MVTGISNVVYFRGCFVNIIFALQLCRRPERGLMHCERKGSAVNFHHVPHWEDCYTLCFYYHSLIHVVYRGRGSIPFQVFLVEKHCREFWISLYWDWLGIELDFNHLRLPVLLISSFQLWFWYLALLFSSCVGSCTATSCVWTMTATCWTPVSSPCWLLSRTVRPGVYSLVRLRCKTFLNTKDFATTTTKTSISFRVCNRQNVWWRFPTN